MISNSMFGYYFDLALRSFRRYKMLTALMVLAIALVIGASLTTLTVFYVLSAIIVGMMSPLFGRADLFLIATVASMLYLVVGAFGVPFVLAMLIVAQQDFKLREQERRGARA